MQYRQMNTCFSLYKRHGRSIKYCGNIFMTHFCINTFAQSCVIYVTRTEITTNKF